MTETIPSTEIARILGFEYRSLVQVLKNTGALNREPLLCKTSGRPTPYWNLSKDEAIVAIALCKNSEQKVKALNAILKNGIAGIKSIDESETKKGFIYVFSTNGKSKIGRAMNATRRIRGLITQHGLHEDEYRQWVSPKIARYGEVEKQSHKFLSDVYVGVGEWFNCPIESGIDAVQKSIEMFGRMYVQADLVGKSPIPKLKQLNGIHNEPA